LYGYDKTDGTIFATTPKDICFEKFFYCKPSDKGTSIEDGLSRLESRFAETCRHIIENKKLTSLSTDDRNFFMLFVASQLLRTKERRIDVEQTSQAILDFVTNQMGITDWRATMKPEAIQALHNSHLVERAGEIAAIIASNLKPIVFINKTRSPFWTSDNPIAKHNDINSWPYGNLGIACRGIQLHFPLSPKVLIMLVDRREYHYLPEDNVVNVTDRMNVVFENNLQITSSTRFIYSSDNIFRLANQYLQEFPRFKDPDRERFSSNLPFPPTS